MALVKVTAIIRRDALEAVETRLKQVGVRGVTVSTVKGFGEYANFFSHDWTVTHARIEIFIAEDEADRIVAAIQETAKTGAAGDGVIAVLPVKRLVRIRTGEQAAGHPPQRTNTSQRKMTSQSGDPDNLTAVAAWVIVVLGVIAASAVIFVASRHQMHFLAAVLGGVLLLCTVFGGLAVARRRQPWSRHDQP